MTALVEILALFAVALNLVATADIAADRGRSLLAWVPAALLAPLVAPVLLWLMPPNPRRFRRCMACREWLHNDAGTCPHCTRDQTA